MEFWNEFSSRSQKHLSLLGVLFFSFLLGTGPVRAVDTSSLGFDPENHADHLRKHYTFNLKRTFQYPAGDTLVQFLFARPEVNADMVRSWNLFSLHVNRIDTRLYHARVKNQMDGLAYKLTVDEGRVRYIGQGMYREDFLPVPIEGHALVELKWEPIPDTENVQMTANLRLRPASEVLHLIGTILHPLARNTLDEALHRLIENGKKLARTLHENPEETTERLRSIDKSHARSWKMFIEHNPGWSNKAKK